MRRRLEGFLPAAALMIAVTTVGLGLVVLGSGAAHGQNPPPPPGEMGGLPPAAFEVCENRATEDPCPITTPDGESVTGQCTPTPDDNLACLPDGPPPLRN